jgi:hypothetical protein
MVEEAVGEYDKHRQYAGHESPQARGGHQQATLGYPKGVFGDCPPEGAALK